MCQAGKPDLRIMTSKRSYERHLPHEIPEGFPIFLTWNLKGAVPQAVIENLRGSGNAWKNNRPAGGRRPGPGNCGRAS